MPIFITFVFALFLLSSQTFAQTPCQVEQYRQFDFWLGQWQVTNSQNTNISASKISLINNGCTLLEEYSTPTGYQGKSLNIYDIQTKQWHQTWTDNTGLLLTLKGYYADGKMVLKGTTLNNENKTVLNRITWQALKNGTVNQQWQTSEDNGKTWQLIFNGLYTKKAS